ncbi:MAG TPA: hypothetical protein VMW87_11720 [Spirochaetia bacterium]|nr:hypothetical protein [Spirochaetia bacterium]
MWLFLGTAHCFALTFSDIEARGGSIWIGNGYTVDKNGNPVQWSDVSPLVGTLGVDLGIPISQNLSVRPALDLFGIQYAQTASGKVVPTQIETANAVLMIGALLSAPVSYTWDLNSSLSISAGASPSFLFRIPTLSYGTPDRSAITSYMYQSLRFFYPEVQGSLLYKFQKTFQFGIALRGLFPIFHLWDGESMPIWDQMMVSGTLFLRFLL